MIRARLFDRYGIEPDRVDVRAAEQLLATLDLTQLDPTRVEASLVAAAVNGESYFLRHHEQFEWLATTWLPAAVARARARARPTLRILSAACSTGEEPYSLAATLAPSMPADLRLDILALDVSERSLAAARVGQYGLWSMRGQRPGSHSWVRVERQRVFVREWVKAPVRFATHNLLESLAPWGQFDLVLCRNTLIYFHAAAIDRVWHNLAEVLEREGVLLTAPSDPWPKPAVGLFPRWEGEVCIYSKTEVCEASPRPDPPEHAVAKPDDPPERAAANPDDDVDTRRAAILRLVRSGELELARDLLVQLTRDAPLHVPAHILLALVATELGERELCAAHARKASFLAPDDPYPVFVMADALERMGHRSQAQHRYRWVAEQLVGTDDLRPLRYADGLLAGQLKDLLDGRNQAL